MGKERELLRKILDTGWLNNTISYEVEELLAQPEPVVTGMSNKETPHYDMSIHSNPSAMAWTKFFRECWPECNLDDETMLGWFANAMMAMHDHIYQTSPPKREPLSVEEIADLWSDTNSVRNFARALEKEHGIGVDDE